MLALPWSTWAFYRVPILDDWWVFLLQAVDGLDLAFWPAMPFTVHAALQHCLPDDRAFLATSSMQSTGAVFMCRVLSSPRVPRPIGYPHLVLPTCQSGLPGCGRCRMPTASWSHRWELDVRWGPKVDELLPKRSTTSPPARGATPPWHPIHPT